MRIRIPRRRPELHRDVGEIVDELMARAEAAGAKIVRPAQKVQRGYFGCFGDPDGHLWKVAAS